MIEFIYHAGIEKEIAKLERRFRAVREGITIFERLCNHQFHPTNPQQVIAPDKLHRITANDLWTVWKVELVVPKSGLRPNQYPRMWFAVKGAVIACLCIVSHVDNYDDEEMAHRALSRVSDIF